MVRVTKKEDQYAEIRKCAKDPVYFIKNFLFISHPTRGRVPFELYPFQEECIRDFVEHKYNVVLKSRQLGLSTGTAAYCLWMALFKRDQNILIMATQLEVGKGMIEKIRTAFNMLPQWLLNILDLVQPQAESVKYIRFSNGSKITAIPTTKNSGRGEAVSLLVVDEAAHVDNLKDLWAGLRPTLSTGGRAIVFSTPAGKGNFFHELWVGADTNAWKPDKSTGATGFFGSTVGPNGFHPIKLPWTVHPERDDSWFENETRSMDARLIAQELLCSYESSGHTYFAQAQIDMVKQNASTPVGFTGPVPSSTDLWIWGTAIPGHKYILSADVARGDSDDFSAFHVIDINTSMVAAEYLGKIPTDEFGVFMVDIAKRYINALIIQEKNTFGVAAANSMRYTGYENFWYEPDIAEKMKYMTPEERKKQIPGFTTTPKNREGILQKLEGAVRNKQIRIHSTRFGEEMEHFIWTGKRGQALKKKHDDLIMALAIGLQAYNPFGSDQHDMDSEAVAWQMAFLKGLSRRTNNLSVGIGANSQSPNPYLTGEKPNPFINSRGLQSYQGKQLPPGVTREKIEQDQAVRNEFWWLFK